MRRTVLLLAAISASVIDCGGSPAVLELTSDGGVSAEPELRAVVARLDRWSVPRPEVTAISERAGALVADDNSPSARVRLPLTANGAFAVEDIASGVTISVSRLDAGNARASVIDGWVVYANTASGSSVAHRIDRFGTEDYVIVDRAGVSSIAYRVALGAHVAGVRTVAGIVEFLDDRGAPRLRMSAPAVLDANGRKLPHSVDVAECAVDTSPVAPWNRAIVSPGAASCVVRVSFRASDAKLPLLVDPAWTATTGVMTSSRGWHTATLLTSGKVLIAGGYAPDGYPQSAAELYDPATKTFAATGAMIADRAEHFAVRLAAGDVLVGSGNGYLYTAERYSPSTGTFTATGSLGNWRLTTAVALLPTGKVLVAGGDQHSSAELYDPSGAGSFSFTGPLSAVREYAAAVLLGNGKVLIAGGGDELVVPPKTYSTAEEYDPATGTFSLTTGSLATARARLGVATISGGRVLFVGGMELRTGSPISTAEIYDPTSRTFSAAGALSAARSNVWAATIAAGPSAGAVVVGGATATEIYSSTSEIFDPATSTFRAAGKTVVGRLRPTVTALATGEVLLAGGEISAAPYRASTAELFAQLALGASCADDGDCFSGHCADGVCCNEACSGACRACTAIKRKSGTDGTCGNIADGFDPDTECTAQSCSGSTVTKAQVCNGAGSCRSDGTLSCGGFTCDGVVCRTTCSSDSDCTSTNYCDGSSCRAKKPAAATCSVGRECMSTFCADGVCCDEACAGTCRACTAIKKGSGIDGVCGGIGDGRDPDAECSGQTCSSSVVTKAQLCNGSGACRSDGITSCGAYACAGTSCATTCASDSDCGSSTWCNAGSCVPSLAVGGACSRTRMCNSAGCFDGVCCDRTCSGTCEACSAAKKGGGADGSCGPIAADTDPDGECVVDSAYPASCKADGMCDGAGRCRLYAKAGTACGVTTCTAGTVTGRICSGAGGCDADAKPCAPYACDAAGNACRTTCAADEECAADAYCTSSGTCALQKKSGTACALGKECKSNLCVDGYCCNASCGGQCEACDIAGSEGTCAPISGKPHGSRLACAGDLAVCGGTCNGTKTSECDYAPTTRSCGSTCKDGQETASACDGRGACAEGKATSCGAYACDSSGKGCAVSCVDDATCAKGFRCSTGTCVPVTGAAHCSDDRAKSIAADRSETACGAYVCDPGSGLCKQVCTETSDCAPGRVCNGGTKTCDPAGSGEAEDSGGCSVPSRTTHAGAGSLAMIAALLALTARRRRVRS
jgi:hypothetical protein